MTEKGDRRGDILEAAFDLLMERGLQDLGFDAVGRRAGASRQLVRYYFPDRESLMVALCDRLAAAYRAALVNGAAEIGQADRLTFFFDFYFDLLESPRKPRDDQAYDAVFAFAAGSAPVRDALATQYGLLGQVVSHEIQVRHPELSEAACLELSYLFVCIMYGHWKMVATLGYSENHGRIARASMDRLLASYLASGGAPARGDKPWRRPQ